MAALYRITALSRFVANSVAFYGAEIKAANPELDKTQIFSEIARVWQEEKAAQVQPENVNEPEKGDDISEIQEAPSDEEAPKKKRGRKAKKPIETNE